MREISNEAVNRWPSILMALGVDQKILNKKHQSCPFCGSGRDRFRFTDWKGAGSSICNQCGTRDGLNFVQDYFSVDFKAAAQMVRGVLGITEEVKPMDTSKNVSRIKQVWGGCRPADEVVKKYLSSRGLDVEKLDLSKVKSHPSLTYYDIGDDGKPNRVGDFHAMVCPVQNANDKMATLHITYLTKAGEKAAVDSPKKMMPPANEFDSPAIRLAQHSGVLAIAEGVETALAHQQATNVPTWAVLNANQMQRFIAPEGVETLLIIGDNDANFTGHKAAYVCANKNALAGLDISVWTAPDVGTDYLDFIRHELGEK